MKKFAFVAALSACAVTLISLAPAQARPDESKRLTPTVARFNVPAAVERTPEQMAAFDATFASPGQVREAAVRPTMDEAQYAQLKHAADLSPRMASRPGALAPNSPLAAVSLKFGGATECDGGVPNNCWIPPDVAGAIGKSQFVSVSNDVFEVRSRGGVLLQTKTLNGLFGYGTTAMFDPRVQYDEEYQRWIVTADAFPIDANTQIFGIAISKTNSATGAWWIYFVNVTGFAGANNFYDFPMLGMTQDAVLFTANIFTPSSFQGSSIFSIAKARLYNGFGASFPVQTGLVGTMQTAHQNLTDQNGYAWYAAAPGNSGAIYMVAESYPANPNLTGFFGYYGVANVPAYSIPPSAAQPAGCGGTLDTLDNRFQNAGTQNGDVYYQVHTVANGGFSEPRYYVITGILGFAPTVATVADVFANGSSWDFNPSIASDPGGHFGLNWSSTLPAAGFPAGNPAEVFADNNGGNPNGTAGHLTVFTSASCMNTSGVSRWGDYSQVSIDPGTGTVTNTNTKISWIDNEIVPSTNFWSTEIAKMKY
jgi:hypothetical protein